MCIRDRRRRANHASTFRCPRPPRRSAQGSRLDPARARSTGHRRLGLESRRPPLSGYCVGRPGMTTTTLGDLLARADDLCRELRDSSDPVPLTAWESFDATAYLLMRELVGPARTGSRTLALSHAVLCRVIDAYPAPLRGASTGSVGAREVAHLLGRPRSAVIARIRKGEIPSTWDCLLYTSD